MIRPRPTSTLFPYTTLFRSGYTDSVPIGAALRQQFPTNWELRSEEHTSELQSRRELVCRLLLEKKKAATETITSIILLKLIGVSLGTVRHPRRYNIVVIDIQ